MHTWDMFLKSNNYMPNLKFSPLLPSFYYWKKSLYVCSQLSQTNMMFNPTPLKQWFKV